MFGVVTRNAEELDWPTFDRRCYEVKSVSGQAREPIAAATSMISCHADTAAAEASPELVPVTESGDLATRERQYFDWGYVCPTHPDYREGLLETIADAADASGDVRLDDVGFPRPEYCFCDRCVEQFAASEYDDRFAWRAAVVTEFVSEAADRVSGNLSLTLHPDPYPGHLHERSGLDLPSLAEDVDEFVVPLYDTAYGTTYWLESLASGFRDALDAPLAIELYAVDIEIENLVHAAEVADAYASDVLFGYDASNAQAAIRRLNAETREGKSHG